MIDGVNAVNVIFGNTCAANCLLYLQRYGKGHPREIARSIDTSVSQVQKQLQKFEHSGVLKSALVGNTRQYEWNSQMPLTQFLREFLLRILESLSQGREGQGVDERSENLSPCKPKDGASVHVTRQLAKCDRLPPVR